MNLIGTSHLQILCLITLYLLNKNQLAKTNYLFLIFNSN